MYCTNCGKQIRPDLSICPVCRFAGTAILIADELYDILKDQALLYEDTPSGALRRILRKEGLLARSQNGRSINDFQLSVRTFKCLKKAGIVTIPDLLQYSETELLKLDNMGPKSLNELKEILAGMGLALRRHQRL